MFYQITRQIRCIYTILVSHNGWFVFVLAHEPHTNTYTTTKLFKFFFLELLLYHENSFLPLYCVPISIFFYFYFLSDSYFCICYVLSEMSHAKIRYAAFCFFVMDIIFLCVSFTFNTPGGNSNRFSGEHSTATFDINK